MSDKWWDISDDELDDLFREASDKVEIPFDQSSFDKLSQKMNSQPQIERFVYLKRAKWLLLFLFVFIGAGVVYLAVEQKGIHVGNAASLSSSIPQQVIKNKSVIKNESENHSHSVQSAQEKQKVSDAKTEKNTDLASPNKILPYTKLTSKEIIQRESITLTKAKAEKTNRFTSIKKSGNDDNFIINTVTNTSKKNIPTNNVLGVQGKQSNTINLLKKKEIVPLAVNLKVDLPKAQIPQEEYAKPVVALPKQKFSRFGVRLAFAPDANAVEKLRSFALGKSVGLLFEYKLSKKLVIQTGAIYAAKTYDTSIDNYHAWAKNWSTRPIKPNNVEGTCNMIDLPLNIRFNVFQKPNQTWFVSSGVSSYLMLEETYEYYYDTPTTPTGLPTYLTWKRDNDYYFSTLNLSFGFEKRIGKGLTIQAEPYLKTPLTEVGRGKVNLYSSGLLFSIKHDF